MWAERLGGLHSGLALGSTCISKKGTLPHSLRAFETIQIFKYSSMRLPNGKLCNAPVAAHRYRDQLLMEVGGGGVVICSVAHTPYERSSAQTCAHCRGNWGHCHCQVWLAAVAAGQTHAPKPPERQFNNTQTVPKKAFCCLEATRKACSCTRHATGESSPSWTTRAVNSTRSLVSCHDHDLTGSCRRRVTVLSGIHPAQYVG